ncbi:MAG: DMT family transporter [Magnetospiraceae bacterium]
MSFANPAFMMVFVATVSLAFKGIFAKLALAAGVTVMAILIFRILFSLPLFWIGAGIMDRHGLRRLGLHDWGLIGGVGLFFFVATVADFWAIAFVGVSLSRIVLFTHPLLIVLLSAAVRREAPARRQLIAFAFAYGGLLVILAPGALGTTMTADFWIGIGLAFLSAASYAIYLFIGQTQSRRVGSLAYTVAAQSGTAIGMLVYGLLAAEAVDLQFSADGLMWILLLVVISTVLPIFLLIEGIRQIGAEHATLLSLIGPVITVIAAWAILDENLSLLQAGGFVLVLVGIGILQTPGKSRQGTA